MENITEMSRPRIAILGAGPAGLGAAWQLVRTGKADPIVLEQRQDVGGNAGSFELDGVFVDYGSHRLHPACEPKILSDLKDLLKDGEINIFADSPSVWTEPNEAWVRRVFEICKPILKENPVARTSSNGSP